MSLLLAAPWILLSVMFAGALRYGLLLLFLLRLRFEPGRVLTLNRDKVPQAVRQILDLAAPRLEALGFSRTITFATWGGGLVVRNRPLFCDAYFNGKENGHAWVTLADDPERGALYDVEFQTCYADGTSLITLNRRLCTLPALVPELVAQVECSASVDTLWQIHLRRQGDSTRGVIVNDPAEAWRRRQRQLAAQPPFLEEQGFLRKGPETGSWRLTLRGAAMFLLRFAPRFPAAERSRARSTDRNTAAQVLADAMAITRSLTASAVAPQGWLVKIALTMGSAVLGVQTLGVQPSWAIAPIFIAVLGFHEWCHLAAMHLSGYRDIGVLSVPMLDAVATVRKDVASVWQRLFVYLAGPLPGIILGVASIDAATHAEGGLHAWLLSFGAVALGVNLFNLLPFPPLDGAKVVESLVLRRSAHLRPGLVAIAAVLFVAGGVYLHVPAASILGAVFLLALPSEWRIWQLAAATTEGNGPLDERRRALPSVLRVLMKSGRAVQLNFSRRAALVRAVLSTVMQHPPRRAHAAVGWMLYTAVLCAPVASYFALAPQVKVRAEGVSTEATASPRPRSASMHDWEYELARTTDPAERWKLLIDAGRQQESSQQYELARAYYRRALAEASGFPAGDLRTVDARIALARTETDAAAAERLYNEALASLGSERSGDRLRVAQIQESLFYLLPNVPAEVRIARLREALAIREGQPADARLEAYNDRRELARMLDRSGDTPAAEALLRKNLSPPGSGALIDGYWARLPSNDLAWFLIAHQRPAEAQSVVAAAIASRRDDPKARPALRELNLTLAWAQALHGDHVAALATLTGLMNPSGAEATSSAANAAALELALDVATVSRLGGDTAEAARGMEQVRNQLNKLSPALVQKIRQRYQTLIESDAGWAAPRWRAHAELIAAS